MHHYFAATISIQGGASLSRNQHSGCKLELRSENRGVTTWRNASDGVSISPKHQMETNTKNKVQVQPRNPT